MPKSWNWKIGGQAGNGIKSTGEIMSKALVKSGYKVFGYAEFPSLIRGGHNTYQIFADEKLAMGPKKVLDVLVALNQDSIDFHKDEIDGHTVIIMDESLAVEGIDAKVLALPIDKTVLSLGSPLIRNTLTLGISAAEMGLDKEIFISLIKKIFGDKPKLIEVNQAAFEAGYKLHPRPNITLNQAVESSAYVMTGSEAVGLGAIAAGLHLYAGYPMTPTTELLHYLARQQDKYGFILRQTEDEIGAINIVLGAAFAGAKVMTATSGGGFDLMQESISLAGILELPIVINLGMRPGPATGLPTWTSQSDLRLAIHSGHGEFPKIVLSPGDPAEAYELTHLAFTYAQQFQVPVIMMTDKLLNESHYTVENLKKLNCVPLMNITTQPNNPEGEMFHRYKTTNNGISDRTLPGVPNGFYVANSDEHNPAGIVDESIEMREIMNRRRALKENLIRSLMEKPFFWGNEEAEITIVGWGSTKGSILEAMKELPEVNYYHFHHVWPLPEIVGSLLKGKRIVVIENNVNGQFAGLLRQEFGIESEKLLKDDGRPFYPEEIIQYIKKIK